MKGATTILAVLMVLSAAATARAETAQSQVPDGCSGRNERSYSRGLQQGANVVNMAWNGIGRDCDRVDYFMDVVADNVSRLSLREGARPYVICRYTGTVDGVYEQLDALYGECADQCFMEGEQIGEMAGEVYCELSLALGGLVEADRFIRGPVQTCGFNFEVGCDSAFIGTTSSFSNDLGTCAEFTEGDYFDVWDETRNNQCWYPTNQNSSFGESESEEEEL